jgi:hypothetical protein
MVWKFGKIIKDKTGQLRVLPRKNDPKRERIKSRSKMMETEIKWGTDPKLKLAQI